MSKTLYGLQIPALDGTRFLGNYVFEDEREAQDAADEISVEKDEVSAKVVKVRLIEKGEESLSLEDKQRDIVQLLKDYRAWDTALGGALSPEDSHVRSADYGPAGLIFTGMEFEKSDRHLLSKSFITLRLALVLLRSERRVIAKHHNGDEITGVSAWSALIEPYLADPADPGVVDDWRRKAQRGYISAGRFIERHDAAIKKLAEYLRYENLHAVFPKLMSEREEAMIEHQNAEIYAVFQRLRVAGFKEDAAVAQTAENFGDISPDYVERVIEFRSEAKPDTCTWGGCDRAPFSQNLCQKHYQKQWRAKQVS